MSNVVLSIRDRFVEAGGHFTQSLGLGRIPGQIYAYCYFTSKPQSLDDLAQALGISKGGVSMAVRLLEQWGALRKIWIKGERKVYYEANTHLGQIIRRVIGDLVGHRLAEADQLLQEAESLIKTARQTSDPEVAFVRSRLERFRAFRDKARLVWDSSLIQRLFS